MSDPGGNKLLIPNTCQVPNVLIDDVMPRLPGSAVKIMFAVVRKTYGFGKRADKLSFTTLQKLTGLSRDAVNEGIKALGSVLIITPGVKNHPGLKGLNEYALNLNVDTGELVGKSDWSENLTSQKSRKKLVRNSDSSKPNSSKPNSVARKKRDNAAPDPRVRMLLDAFITKYEARTGQKYAIVSGKDQGKDPAMLKQRLAVADPETIMRNMDRYFCNDFYGKIGFDVAGFCSAFNRLNSAGAKKKHNYEDGGFPEL